MAEAQLETPVAGTCHTERLADEWFGPYTPTTVACTARHAFETAWVGTLPDSLASQSTSPGPGSTDLAFEQQTCTTKANAYLGGNWQTGYVTLELTTPPTGAWRAGARWFACNIAEVTEDWALLPVNVSVSLRGVLGAGGALTRTCAILDDDSTHEHITSETAIDCASPHNAEFAGLLRLSDATYPSDATVRWRHENYACNDTFRDFLGVSYGSSKYFGFFHYDITQTEWNLGIRTTPCILFAYDEHGSAAVRYTGSIRGLGNRKPANWTENK